MPEGWSQVLQTRPYGSVTRRLHQGQRSSDRLGLQIRAARGGTSAARNGRRAAGAARGFEHRRHLCSGCADRHCRLPLWSVNQAGRLGPAGNRRAPVKVWLSNSPRSAMGSEPAREPDPFRKRWAPSGVGFDCSASLSWTARLLARSSAPHAEERGSIPRRFTITPWCRCPSTRLFHS